MIMSTPSCYKQLVFKSDYVQLQQLEQTLNLIAVVHLTIFFFSNYQYLLVIFTPALSPTISSTHY